MRFLDGQWPWWLGAFGLASVCVLHLATLGRPCAVSGFWSAVLSWRKQREAARAEAAVDARPADVERAMREAVLGELAARGEQVPPELAALLADESPAGASGSAPSAPPPRAEHPSVALTFLVALVAGGILAALARGDLGLVASMGATHAELFGQGVTAWLALLVGGALTGFGTRMAGGCTMGHGLSGNAALQPGSFVATATFFGTAIAVAFTLQGLLR
jgi:uncharacterized membrane protein YedE/YeeE